MRWNMTRRTAHNHLIAIGKQFIRGLFPPVTSPPPPASGLRRRRMTPLFPSTLLAMVILSVCASKEEVQHYFLPKTSGSSSNTAVRANQEWTCPDCILVLRRLTHYPFNTSD